MVLVAIVFRFWTHLQRASERISRLRIVMSQQLTIMLDRIKRKGKEHVKRLARLTDKDAKPTLHSHPPSYLDHSEGNRLLRNSSDSQALAGVTEVSGHDSKSHHNDASEAAIAEAMPPPPSHHQIGALLTPPQHYKGDEDEPPLPLKAVRSSTLRSRRNRSGRCSRAFPNLL